MGGVVALEEALDPSEHLQPLVEIVADDIRAVNRLILDKAVSDVALIPKLAHHLIDSGGKRLRPILLKTLKPGARIVSHHFLMGDWKPLKSESVTDGYGGEYDIHMWKIGQDEEKKE